jgi:hypothetical protein
MRLYIRRLEHGRQRRRHEEGLPYDLFRYLLEKLESTVKVAIQKHDLEKREKDNAKQQESGEGSG